MNPQSSFCLSSLNIPVWFQKHWYILSPYSSTFPFSWESDIDSCHQDSIHQVVFIDPRSISHKIHKRYNPYHLPCVISNWCGMRKRTHHKVFLDSLEPFRWAIHISLKTSFHIHPISTVSPKHKTNSPQSFWRNGDPKRSTLSQST